MAAVFAFHAGKPVGPEGHHPGGGEDVHRRSRPRRRGVAPWRRIGVVSPELQLRYRKPVRVREVVLSGFFDSIGLYRRPDLEQEAMAADFQRLPSLYAARTDPLDNTSNMMYMVTEKKTPQLKKQDIDLAEKRMEDRMRRFPKGGEI